MVRLVLVGYVVSHVVIDEEDTASRAFRGLFYGIAVGLLAWLVPDGRDLGVPWPVAVGVGVVTMVAAVLMVGPIRHILTEDALITVEDRTTTSLPLTQIRYVQVVRGFKIPDWLALDDLRGAGVAITTDAPTAFLHALGARLMALDRPPHLGPGARVALGLAPPPPGPGTRLARRLARRRSR